MQTYKIQFESRNENDWVVVDSGTLDVVIREDFLKILGNNNFSPIREKLFNQDIIKVNLNTGQYHCVASLLRNQMTISGILVLEKNRVYGRYNNGKKMLYKCIPDDKRLPIFLIPYTLDTSNFSKCYINKYVIFKFKEWIDIHPIGELTHTIGDVDKLENFYEYQLYCKSLNASIQDFTQDAKMRMREMTETAYIKTIQANYNVENRCSWKGIYSIDPIGSRDFDDAFGIRETTDEKYVMLSVYISNVALWMDVLRLWKSFSKRISTIYLPDRKRPMLPTVLSDILCSLLEGQVRFAFTMDIIVNIETGKYDNVSFKNTSIIVEKNYRYDEDTLENNTLYQKMFKIVKKMSSDTKIEDSHDIVAYLMILMNYQCAKRFIEYKNGIFRSFKFKSEIIFPSSLPKDILTSLKLWHSNGSSYIGYDEDKVHDMMKFSEYVHITSPIRRLIDLLNIMLLQHNLGLVLMNDEMKIFYDKWTSIESMSYINQSMRSIRKVQNECALLSLCVNNPTILEKEYDGYIFDIMERNDGLFLYIVYVPEFKMTSKFIYYSKIELYNKHKFKVYLFEDKDMLKKKIRMEMIL